MCLIEAELGFAGSGGDAKLRTKQLFTESLIRRRWGRPCGNYDPLSCIEPRNFSDLQQHLKSESEIEIKKIPPP